MEKLTVFNYIDIIDVEVTAGSRFTDRQLAEASSGWFKNFQTKADVGNPSEWVQRYFGGDRLRRLDLQQRNEGNVFLTFLVRVNKDTATVIDFLKPIKEVNLSTSPLLSSDRMSYVVYDTAGDRVSSGTFIATFDNSRPFPDANKEEKTWFIKSDTPISKIILSYNVGDDRRETSGIVPTGFIADNFSRVTSAAVGVWNILSGDEERIAPRAERQAADLARQIAEMATDPILQEQRRQQEARAAAQLEAGGVQGVGMSSGTPTNNNLGNTGTINSSRFFAGGYGGNHTHGIEPNPHIHNITPDPHTHQITPNPHRHGMRFAESGSFIDTTLENSCRVGPEILINLIYNSLNTETEKEKSRVSNAAKKGNWITANKIGRPIWDYLENYYIRRVICYLQARIWYTEYETLSIIPTDLDILPTGLIANYYGGVNTQLGAQGMGVSNTVNTINNNMNNNEDVQQNPENFQNPLNCKNPLTGDCRVIDGKFATRCEQLNLESC